MPRRVECYLAIDLPRWPIGFFATRKKESGGKCLVWKWLLVSAGQILAQVPGICGCV